MSKGFKCIHKDGTTLATCSEELDQLSSISGKCHANPVMLYRNRGEHGLELTVGNAVHGFGRPTCLSSGISP
jgi:hypothetical protein